MSTPSNSSVSSASEQQLLIETDILGEFLVSNDNDPERGAVEPRLLRALRSATCYTTMLNAYELLHAARNEEEQQHIYSALSLVRVLGKKPEHTHIVIQEINEEDWGFSGLLTDDWKKLT